MHGIPLLKSSLNGATEFCGVILATIAQKSQFESIRDHKNGDRLAQ